MPSTTLDKIRRIINYRGKVRPFCWIVCETLNAEAPPLVPRKGGNAEDA